MPIHTQSTAGYTPYPLGSKGGVESVTLATAQIPSHSHQLQAFTTAGNAANPANNFPAATAPSTVANFGGNQGHENRQPSMALNYCIAWQGIFPPRS